jgi:hypothetical protein
MNDPKKRPAPKPPKKKPDAKPNAEQEARKVHPPDDNDPEAQYEEKDES